jgi:hypothetical protein
VALWLDTYLVPPWRKSLSKQKEVQKSTSRIAGSRHWNNPDVKVRVSERFYVEAFNALSLGLFGADHTRLECLDDLAGAIRSHGLAADHYRQQNDVQSYFAHNQLACFLKKLELSKFESDAERVAMEKWLAAEGRCKEINSVFIELLKNPESHRNLRESVRKVKREIHELLGNRPPNLADVSRFMKFGPGASLSHPREEGAAPFKLLNPSAYSFNVEEVEWLAWHTKLGPFITGSKSLGCSDYVGNRVAYYDHARYATVPKSVWERRTIEIGPSLTGYVQQGFDGFIRQCLLDKWNLDLRDQEPNKNLAYVGSITGGSSNSPCTIDLSSASDSISYALVGMLLPSAWFDLLKRYRAKTILLPDGTVHWLEKFSSMGNALTFSLQTMIFAAVVRSILRERGHEGAKWRVYGDDIIVPYRIYDEVVARLTCFGFSVNTLKSFKEGNFRESCGADYFLGMNTRPYYLKKVVSEVPHLYKILNLVQLQAMRAPIPAMCYRPLYQTVLSHVPVEFRLYGDTLNAPDSCIWAPHTRGADVVIRRRQREWKMPEHLALLTTLLSGYQDNTSADMTKAGVHRDPLSFPESGDGKCVLRKARFSGLAGLHARREDLPFDPILMG